MRLCSVVAKSRRMALSCRASKLRVKVSSLMILSRGFGYMVVVLVVRGFVRRKGKDCRSASNATPMGPVRPREIHPVELEESRWEEACCSKSPGPSFRVCRDIFSCQGRGATVLNVAP